MNLNWLQSKRLNKDKMLLESSFKHITQLFFNGEYEEGQKEVTCLLEIHPNNPMLLANRALFRSQLNQDQLAMKDLQFSLELQPFNYISYFNLFSINSKNNEERLALNNINCSLSVMYLLKGKHTKSVADLERAIHLAPNNIEARVLKGLILMQRGEYQKSKKQFTTALEFHPSNGVLQNLVDIASAKIDPQAGHVSEICSTLLPFNRRLSSIRVIRQNQNITDQISKKVDEFNLLYTELNQEIGGITQKVTKESSFLNCPPHAQLDKSKVSSRSAINALDEEIFQQHPFKGLKKNSQGNATTDMFERVGTQSEVKLFSERPAESIIKEEQEDEGMKTGRGLIRTVLQNENNVMYPHGQSLSVTITLIQFSSHTPQHYSHHENVYCILSYDHGREKMISQPVACSEDGICCWNKTFKEITLSREAAPLKIRLYNKQRTQIKDLFLGQFQVLLTTADILKIQLEDTQSAAIGDILIHVKKGPFPQN